MHPALLNLKMRPVLHFPILEYTLIEMLVSQNKTLRKAIFLPFKEARGSKHDHYSVPCDACICDSQR